MVVAPTRIPSLRSSPWMRTAPQRRVLPGQTKDQITDLRVDPWPSRLSGPAIGPLSPDQLPMPSQERLRRDDEGRPPVPMKAAAHRGEEHTVQGPELGAARLSSEDSELMAQDEDF